MPNWNQTLRIRGEQLNESDTFIDVTVEDHAMSGHVRLAEDGGDRTWNVVASQLDEWYEDGTLAEKGQLAAPDHEIWSLINRLESHIGDDGLAPIESELRDLADELYSMTTRAQRQVGPPTHSNGNGGTGSSGSNSN